MRQDRITKLRRLKAKRKLSYEALGDELGVHAISVFRWLRKGVVPRSRPVLQAIDRLLVKYSRSSGGIKRKSRLSEFSTAATAVKTGGYEKSRLAF